MLAWKRVPLRGPVIQITFSAHAQTLKLQNITPHKRYDPIGSANAMTQSEVPR